MMIIIFTNKHYKLNKNENPIRKARDDQTHFELAESGRKQEDEYGQRNYLRDEINKRYRDKYIMER